MRKAWLALAVLVGMAAPAKAYDFWSLVKDKSVLAVSTYTFSTSQTSSATILVDLSDTVNFPHKATRQLNISSIRVVIDKAAAGTISLRFGVVNFVNTSTGSVTWFWHVPTFSNVSNTANVHFTTGEYFYKLRVNPLVPTTDTDGATPFIISNNKTSGSTTYQTDVALLSPVAAGTGFPGVGDLVMEVLKGATAQSVSVEVVYHAE